MITTYQGLIDAITSYLYDRKDLAPSIPHFVSAAEAKIYRLLRIRANEIVLTQQLSSNIFPIPSDYLETKLLAFDGIPLKRISDSELATRQIRDSKPAAPRNFARIGNEFYIHPPPGNIGELTHVYYAHYNGALEQGQPSPVFDIAPDLYLHGALCEASAFLGQDSRIPVWERLYLSTLEELRLQEAEDEYSGTGIAVQNAEGSRYDRAY